MSDCILEMTGVAKGYPKRLVLQDLHFRLKPGSVTGLLGRNGAGKTTFLKCALGLQRVDAGEVRLLSEPVRTLSAAAKARLGYVPQEPSLYAWMSIQQVIAYTAAFYPRWNHDLVARLLAEWSINPRDRVGTLSTGQLQKLSILLALGHEPDLLVLDEPVASLDPSARRQFLATLLEIALSGDRTILFSTHITSDLERVADQVAILKDGRVLYDDELSSLKDSVKRLRVRAPQGLPTDLDDVPGLLSCQKNGTSAVLSVQSFTPELHQRLLARWSTEVLVEDLNLEEIFLELHHG